jgi:hypothetical protein
MIAIADLGLHSVYICDRLLAVKAMATNNVRGMKNNELWHQDIDFLQPLHSNFIIGKLFGKSG